MPAVQNFVVRGKGRMVEILPSDHKRLKVMAVHKDMTMKALVTQLIDGYKELQMIKAG